MFKNGMRPVHPGEILREDYLVPLGMTATALAKALNVPAPRINDIVRERHAVTADTAMRLARYFGGDARSWLNCKPHTTFALPRFGMPSTSSVRLRPRRHEGYFLSPMNGLSTIQESMEFYKHLVPNGTKAV